MPERLTRSRRSLVDAATLVNGAPARSQDPSHRERRRVSATAAAEATKNVTPVKRERSRSSSAVTTTKRVRTKKGTKADPESSDAAKIATKIEVGSPGSSPVPSTNPSGSQSKAKPKKANPYNLTPGASPYPSYPRPTPEECRQVHDLLSAVHGLVKAPKTIPAPNLQTSGCGEVPSVLDALIRTRLSAATNGANSSRAFRGLVDKFGVIKEGVGKGSVDWNKVRQAPVKDVFEAIKSGGLADVKSRDIQKILGMVYEENRDGESGENGSRKPGTNNKTVLSLDHLHRMESEAAFNKLLAYPGIGPKTASCVLLFCMQRPSFAVDTHVFRLVSWLGWVPSASSVRRMAKEAKDLKTKAPPPVARNSAYAHLDIRIPDELKYPLHYLFIRHGKTCPFCSAKKDGKIREAWGEKKCPLAQLKSGKGVDAIKKETDAELDIEAKEERTDTDGADSGAEGQHVMHGVKAQKGLKRKKGK